MAGVFAQGRAVQRKGYYPDHERKLLWVVILKCGSTAQTDAIGKTGPAVDHATAAALSADYFTVCFVRHPYDRIVSALYTVKRNGDPFHVRMAELVEGKAPGELDRHLIPYWYATEGMRIDFWGRVPHMAEDLAKLRRLFPHIGEPVRRNSGAVRPPSWMDVGYDWRRVEDIYARDLELCHALML